MRRLRQHFRLVPQTDIAFVCVVWIFPDVTVAARPAITEESSG